MNQYHSIYIDEFCTVYVYPGSVSKDHREKDGGRGLDHQVCLRQPSPITLTIALTVTPMEALNNTTF